VIREELREQLRLAVPLAAQHLGFQLMGTVDAALLGHYDERALAAAGVGNNLLFGIVSVGLGVVMGLDTVIPQAIGASRGSAAARSTVGSAESIDDARRYLAAGLRLALIVGIVTSIVVLASPGVLELTAMPAAVRHDVWWYVWLRALGVVPYLVSVALRSYLAANNVTRPLVVVVIAGNLVNAALDLVLIFGAGLGVAGAALATTIVNVLTVAVYAAAVRGLGGFGLRRRPGDIRAIARYGLPVGGQLCAEIGIFGVATVLAAHLGETPAAAHTIALNLSSFTFALAVGVGAATNVRVGHAIGAGDGVAARTSGVTGFLLGLAVMGVGAVAFVAIPGLLAHLFTDADEVIAQAVPLLQIAALFQLSDGAQAIGAGALRGLGDTRATFVGNVIGHYLVGFPISLALGFGAGMGVVGLWWGLSAGLTVTALALLARFLRATR
jgi:MATE family, multidrug efflux pump